jgi:hypothetical protein
VFDSNPQSADYNPRYFNRCMRSLAEVGALAPAEPVEEPSRRLGDR